MATASWEPFFLAARDRLEESNRSCSLPLEQLANRIRQLKAAEQASERQRNPRLPEANPGLDEKGKQLRRKR
ncbi:hypothetical protein ACFTR5_20680 [Bacillus velezensis]